MKNRSWVAITCGVVVSLLVWSSLLQMPVTHKVAADKTHQTEPVDYVLGEIVVELKENVGESFWQGFNIPLQDVERLDKYESIASLVAKQLALEPGKKDAWRDVPQSQYLVRVPEGAEAYALSMLAADDRVLVAERAVYWRPCDIPTDPLWNGVWLGVFFGQWYAKKAEFPRAWDRTHGRDALTGKRPVVGVIDTAFETTHIDLVANVDPRSRNFTPNGLPEHGTAVAGEIASPWNGLGIAGEAPEALLVLLGAGFPGGSQFGRIDSAKVIEAMNYFIASVPEGGVVNMSFAGPGRSDALLNMIRAANVLVFASAGNNGNDQIVYPAGLNQDTSKVIAVAASDFNDGLTDGSNFGFADLAAPGSGNLTTAPGNTWGGISLTSGAAGCASGAAALVWYLDGGNALQVRQRILRSVDLLPQFSGKVKTGGRLNAGRAAWGELNPAPPLNANFGKALYQAAETQPVTFSLDVSNPDARVTWTFGDGVVITGSFTATHTYQRLGQYTVRASVTDNTSEVSPTAAVTVTDFVTLRVKRKRGGAKLVLTATSSQQRGASLPTLTLVETGRMLSYNPDSDAYKLKIKTSGLPTSLTVRSSLGGEATQSWR